MTAKDLKNALLQEAVQGKLVPQIASEGNAKDLLEEIRKEKEKFVKEGKLKKEKPLPEITEEDIPFDIPENWCWCRLGELITFVGGYAYDSHSFIDKSDYQVLRLGNVKNGYLQLSAKPVFINAELAEKTNAFKCITNDILVTMTGTRLKRDYFFTTLVTKYDENLYINQRVGCLRPTKFIFANFLAWILKSKPILDYIFEFETGTANQGNLGSENIKTIPIPLPPLSEQKRIVAAIEKFMPLIEEYGKKETELKAFNEQIGALTKKAILQEAVQGKLVPQIASEGNARDLLEEIRKERLSHGFANSYGICGGKGKKSKNSDLRSKSQIRVKKKELPEITEDEIPFDIPESWCWCRITDIATCELGKTKDALKNKGEMKDYLCSINIQEEGIDLSKVKQMKFEESEYERYTVKKNDLLICEGGDAGRCAIYDRDEPMYYQNALHRVRFFCDLNPKFYLYVFQVYKANKILTEASKGVTIQHLTGAALKELCFPLPPLAEQKRIVEAIEHLLPLCEALKI